MANHWEDEARSAKVGKIVDALDRVSEGVSNADVYAWARTLTEDGWAMVAGAAKVNLPSDTTRQLVINLLERRARVSA